MKASKKLEILQTLSSLKKRINSESNPTKRSILIEELLEEATLYAPFLEEAREACRFAYDLNEKESDHERV